MSNKRTKGGSEAKRRILLWLLLIPLCGALALCYTAGRRYERSKIPPEPDAPLTEEEIAKDFSYLQITRADHETDGEHVLEIDLSEADRVVEIREAGVYRLRGEMKGGILIDAEEQNVHLILDGVRITSGQGPAMLVQSAGKVILTLAEGSENTISDSADYRETPEAEACIYSKADLTINGKGKLIVNGLYKDGIRSQDVVRILDGELNIKCKRTGIHGTDGVHIMGGQISLACEKNGLRTTKSGENGRGDVIIAGGDLQIIAGRNAFLVGRGDLFIYDCAIRAKSVVIYNVGGRTSVQDGCVQ